MEDAQKLDMSQLEGIFSGGDSLSVELKAKVDVFLREHGAKEQIREGYGTTECVTASCLTPRFFFKGGAASASPSLTHTIKLSSLDP